MWALERASLLERQCSPYLEKILPMLSSQSAEASCKMAIKRHDVFRDDVIVQREHVSVNALSGYVLCNRKTSCLLTASLTEPAHMPLLPSPIHDHVPNLHHEDHQASAALVESWSSWRAAHTYS